eukprot:scpid63733/ scgid1466/ Putative iroquois-class homeodomain protein irx-1
MPYPGNLQSWTTATTGSDEQVASFSVSEGGLSHLARRIESFPPAAQSAPVKNEASFIHSPMVTYNSPTVSAPLNTNQWSTVPRPAGVINHAQANRYAPYKPLHGPHGPIQGVQHGPIGVYSNLPYRTVPVPRSLPLSAMTGSTTYDPSNQPLSANSTGLASTEALLSPQTSSFAMPTMTQNTVNVRPVTNALLSPVPTPGDLTPKTPSFAPKEKKATRPYKLPVGAARKAAAANESQVSPSSETSGGLSPLDSFRVRSWPLRVWLYNHRNNPYPKRAEKCKLAKEVGWTPDQVSMWFANTRRRIKKVGMDVWSGGEYNDLNLKDTKVSTKSPTIRTPSPSYYLTPPMSSPLEHHSSSTCADQVSAPVQPITMQSLN